MWHCHFGGKQAGFEESYRGCLQLAELTGVSYMDNLPDWNYPWHQHGEEYELVMVTEGSGMLHLQSEAVQLPLTQGSVVLIPAQVYHYYSSPPDGRMAYCGCYLLAESAGIGALRGLGLALGQGSAYVDYFMSSILAIYERVQASQGLGDLTVQLMGQGLQAIALELLAQGQAVRLPPRDQLSYAVMVYISQNFRQPITLQSLAERFSISSTHLNRVFQEDYHTSPISYLIYNRVLYGAEALRCTERSVEDIASDVCYPNVKHFINLFTKRIGCTPAEYRRKCLLEKKNTQDARFLTRINL